MASFITKSIKEVLTNDVVATDVYSDGRLIISKNTPLTERLLTLLKNRCIKELAIIVDEVKEKNKIKSVAQVDEEVGNNKERGYLNELFFENLKQVGMESRYGNLLSSSEDVEFVMKLFRDIMRNEIIANKLNKLKNWDSYTFFHSFDVFVIGSLFARRKSIPNIESVSLGYLLHDIGKLHIPQRLLMLERKLSYKEFEVMKTHTTKGCVMLQTLGLNHIAPYAKSHHERTDGTGYPSRLKGHEMDQELKILHIVDVYSALTFNRPYRKALSASKALDTLFRDAHHYDIGLLRDFIELLKIYPNNSSVLLSDNTHAKVVHVNEALPMFPVVKRSNDLNDFHLPYNFNIKVSRMIEYQSKSFQDRFKEFSKSLIGGYEELFMAEFIDLADGMKIEEIYKQIIIPVTRVLTILYEGHVMDKDEYYLRISSVLRLLQSVEDLILKTNHYKGQILLVAEGSHNLAVHLKVLEGLLHIENIYPIVINKSISMEQLEKTVADFNVEKVFIFNSTDDTELKEVKCLPNIMFRSMTCKELDNFINSEVYFSNQSNSICEWLETHSKPLNSIVQ
ncbi:HD domain-containing phosphohydrolase [Sporosarcina sp. FSL W7-1349]|uniref:HD-GYP domain-containing protein n=1 Tax=Sporosarcina sp. FSL W7-1349 TaxID=2921561 RepID=UPI0030F506B6